MIAQPLPELYSKLSKEQGKRLSYNLSDVKAGKSEVIRTPFLKDLTQDDILEMFDRDVFSVYQDELNNTLLSIEGTQKQKFGPRSIQKNWEERKAELFSSFRVPDFSIESDYSDVLDGHSALRPLALSSVMSAMKRTTNAGLPHLVAKAELLDSQDPLKYALDPEDWPCVMFTRTQEEGKTRTVWGYPFNKLSAEGRYFIPVFGMIKREPYFAAYSGPDYVDFVVSDMLYRRSDDEQIFSEDFSSFDNSVVPELITGAFGVVESYFQANSQAYDDLHAILWTFLNIPIVTPDGVISGHHGIPSGSWFTSLIGSLVHLLAQNEVMGSLDPFKNQVMGDDGIVILPKSWSMSNLADGYHKINLELNQDKTFVSDNEVIYLQRYYSDDYKVNGTHRGIYPVYRALNRLIHMERWTDIARSDITGRDYFSIRAIAILENCKWHPMHKELVKWVAEKDKYGLEYNPLGLYEYAKLLESRRDATLEHQYSDNVKGIHGFETVKILKDKEA
jgi:hypothetical protein